MDLIKKRDDSSHQQKLRENLRCVGMVEDTRQVNGHTSIERRFYLTSLPPDAKEFARAVRSHWSVENNLHWCLDVCFNEDQARARSGFAAQNLSTLRRLCLNILKRDPNKKLSINRKRFKAALNPNFLASLLGFLCVCPAYISSKAEAWLRQGGSKPLFGSRNEREQS
jgi:predicted transposase YbfD/YdcC